MRAAALLLAGLVPAAPAAADVVRPTVVWTCQEEEGASFARFDLTQSGLREAGPAVVPVTGEGPDGNPIRSCTLPWGVLTIEVTGYNSPGTNGRCGAAEGWGLAVRVDDRLLLDAEAESATACHDEGFNPFEGWVQADQDSLAICRRRASPEGLDDIYDCDRVFADAL